MSTTAVSLLVGAQSITGAISDQQQAGAVLSSGRYNQNLANWNATIADKNATDAERRGQIAANRQRSQTRQTVGAQRAALAAQGLSLDSGTAVDLQADTSYFGELDALTIRNNAAREAWGYTSQATDLRAQGRQVRSQAEQDAANLKRRSYGTLLTGGTQLYGIRQGAK